MSAIKYKMSPEDESEFRLNSNYGKRTRTEVLKKLLALILLVPSSPLLLLVYEQKSYTVISVINHDDQKVSIKERKYTD